MEKLQKTYMPIKSTGSCQGRIQNIRQVCRSHQYYALYNESKVHFQFQIQERYSWFRYFNFKAFTSFCSKPSISTSNWCSVFLVWPSHCFRVDPTASISSINMMHGAYKGVKQMKIRKQFQETDWASSQRETDIKCFPVPSTRTRRGGSKLSDMM